jgi:hypothetical protein
MHLFLLLLHGGLEILVAFEASTTLSFAVFGAVGMLPSFIALLTFLLALEGTLVAGVFAWWWTVPVAIATDSAGNFGESLIFTLGFEFVLVGIAFAAITLRGGAFGGREEVLGLGAVSSGVADQGNQEDSRICGFHI